MYRHGPWTPGTSAASPRLTRENRLSSDSTVHPRAAQRSQPACGYVAMPAMFVSVPTTPTPGAFACAASRSSQSPATTASDCSRTTSRSSWSANARFTIARIVERAALPQDGDTARRALRPSLQHRGCMSASHDDDDFMRRERFSTRARCASSGVPAAHRRCTGMMMSTVRDVMSGRGRFGHGIEWRPARQASVRITG